MRLAAEKLHKLPSYMQFYFEKEKESEQLKRDFSTNYITEPAKSKHSQQTLGEKFINAGKLLTWFFEKISTFPFPRKN